MARYTTVEEVPITDEHPLSPEDRVSTETSQSSLMSESGTATRRLKQIFEYIRELTRIRQPTAKTLNACPLKPEFLDNWPHHPALLVQRGEPLDISNQHSRDGHSQAAPIIRVRRPELTICPEPPSSIRSWLLSGWNDPREEPRVISQQNQTTPFNETTTVRFDEDEERVSAWRNWRARRNIWAVAEQPARLTHCLYERIYEVWTHTRREMDRVELVLADGFLALQIPTTDRQGLSIEYPVLLQKLSIQFEADSPEFQFWPDSEYAELDRSLLVQIPSLDSQTLAKLVEEVEARRITPLGGQKTTAFLTRLVQELFVKGEFCEIKRTTKTHPTIWRNPVVFVRPRTTGLDTIIESIISDLDTDSPNLPKSLIQIAGCCDLADITGDDNVTQKRNRTLTRILFNKTANKEQSMIARRLEMSDYVLVQGPPGTGKTHTIANLIGHFLGKGQTVLVSAHTSKALRVLHDQIDERLQPLCLSVLERDAQGSEDLKFAVQKINARVTESQADDLRRQADDLMDRYVALERELDGLRERLRSARFSEIEEIVISGHGIRPSEAAKEVADGENVHKWLPGPINSGESCSLSDAEIRQIYAWNTAVSMEDEQELQRSQPSTKELLDPTEFHEYKRKRSAVLEGAIKHRTEYAKYWDENAGGDVSVSRLNNLLNSLEQVQVVLSDNTPWRREVLMAGWFGDEHTRIWKELVENAEELVTDAAATRSEIAKRTAKLPQTADLEHVESTLDEIVRHLKPGHQLGRFTELMKPRWKKTIANCRTFGRMPKDREDFVALRDAARVKKKKARLISYWNDVMKDVSGPFLDSADPHPEWKPYPYVNEIRTRTEWRDQLWEPFYLDLSAVGFRWRDFLKQTSLLGREYDDFIRISEAVNSLKVMIESYQAMLKCSILEARVKTHCHYLSTFLESRTAHDLKYALATWCPDEYDTAHSRLVSLEYLRDEFNCRQQLLNKLTDTAKEWATSISLREAPYHNLGKPASDPKKAWRWRQLKQELERRSEQSINELLDDMHNVQDESQDLAGKIIDLRAWAAQCDRIGLAEQQALVGFVKTIDKIGKGYGKKVSELKARAKDLLESARRAVPVWIMPLSRVYESFDPRTKTFDVVIIDEASQSDVTALAALYLGRKHIIVGDNEQVTPDTIGIETDEVHHMIDTYLNGIPNRPLYDGQTSIYDLAETSFVGGIVRLREHFRCVPEIIQFSNILSYENTIRPLREPSSATVGPAVVSERVQGIRVDQTNEAEAETIASLISACLQNPVYSTNDKKEPTSFGVITLLGQEQATLIGEKLWEYLRDRPEAFTKHRLLCGTAAQFQGDERDVIFISLVDGPPEEGRLQLKGDGPAKRFRKRYNVAASRARNQLWVVHSIDPTAHLKEGDLRRQLIQHARDPNALMRAMEEQGAKTESELEKRVLLWLQSAGYRVRSQWPVGAFRIDLVVVGADAQLAVECDGERYHPPEKLAEDMQRQADLERLGWRFSRIRGSVFFRNPERAMAPVVERLRTMGIVPLREEIPKENQEVSSLLEKIRKDAEELRRQRNA